MEFESFGVVIFFSFFLGFGNRRREEYFFRYRRFGLLGFIF